MNAQQLKNSILQEAIQGRLVPQDPTDEPASALLERIRAEKERLVKAGKLKKKDLVVNPISEDEIPFDIPDSWEWVRMGDITVIARGGSPRPIKEYLTDAPNGLNWIKIGDTDKGGKYINSCKEKIKPEGLKKTRMVHPGDFLLTNSMSFGRPYITNIEGCIHDGWLMISPYAGVFDQSYLYYILSSAYAYKQFCDKVAGAVVQNLNSDKVADSIVPLPPLAEQKRIVAKIEELLPKVEEYGKAQEALDKLNAELPDRLKKSVLQEAIEGRLVPQDPTDEPASVLLAKIRQEKEQLVKAGKLKKKDLAVKPISEDEIPFEIPDSWEWVRFGTITINRDSERIPLSVDQRSKLVKSYDYYGASGVIDKVDKYLFDKPLLLIGEDGANLINRSTPIAFIAKGKYWVNNHAHVLDYQNEDLMKYMCLYINSISLVEYVTGTAQPKMNQEKMNSIVVALPPLAEQKRIVAKIEEVFAEIDKLKK
ncbi:restriction endonuclease subunit S [Prevotella sp. P6B4]|uniref:restriction endonuclease subunit S n=1 Tax=Prevotella sp. P6B4 TaxID=1410614 RepID=UPI00048FB9C5|nr:restriction endonuclease subunit S [Prevotella sp. P6B4]